MSPGKKAIGLTYPPVLESFLTKAETNDRCEGGNVSHISNV